MDLSIVIPCYNEVDNVSKMRAELSPVLDKLGRTQSVEVIFVEDGCTDGTYEALAATFHEVNIPNVTLKIERHAVNQGLGAAIRTGFAASQGDVVITTDSDGTYKFSEIPNLLSYLTPDVDIVTASPYHPKGDVAGVPAYRLVLSKGASAIYRALTSWRVHTYTALFRAYRRAVIDHVPFNSNGYLAVTQLLVNSMQMGYQVAEYPTVLHSRLFGESKAKVARIIRTHLEYQKNIIGRWYPYGTLLKSTDDCVYLYDEGKIRLFSSPEIFLSHGYRWEQIVSVDDDYLATLPSGPQMTFRDGTLLKTAASAVVYLLENNQKRAIRSAALFKKLGYQSKYIITVSQATLDDIDDGADIVSTQTYPDGTLLKATDKSTYLIQQGRKRFIPSAQVFLSWYYQWDQVITISDQALSSYPQGEELPAQKTAWRFLQQRGKKKNPALPAQPLKPYKRPRLLKYLSV